MKIIKAWGITKYGRLMDWEYDEEQGVSIIRKKKYAVEICERERRIFIRPEEAERIIKVVRVEIKIVEK